MEHDGYCITVFSAPNYCDQMRAPPTCPAMPLQCCSARICLVHRGVDVVVQVGHELGIRVEEFGAVMLCCKTATCALLCGSNLPDI